ncbi:MAG: DUF805 domain-containing protein [Ruminococcus sp.]|jgi:uncharacterized membrane protein YhaH (DUF805 family)|nr:DUF805 domain-containing protein [Ruminococcus sp.]
MENYPKSFNPISAFGYAMEHYFDFDGRARREEFWMFALAIVVINAVLSLLTNLLGGGATIDILHPMDYFKNFGIMTIINSVVGLILLIPMLSAGARRMHDTDRSGFWVLINFVPVIGQIVYLLLACIDSTPGKNTYGDNPKGIE